MSYDSYDKNKQIQIELLNNTINLDRPCYKCVKTSRGYFSDEPERVSKIKKEYADHCDICDGKRWLLTDEGETIMHLIRRHNKQGNNNE